LRGDGDITARRKPATKRIAKLDPFKDYIQERLQAAAPDKIPAVVLFREIRQRGYRGGETRVKDFVRGLRPPPQPDPVVRFETGPGQQMQVDWASIKLQDVITKLEPELFLAVTGLTVKDFHLLVSLKVFNTEQMNQAVFAFRRYEDASLRYTGIESHEGLTHYGLYDTVVARELI
jgi:hypothetical protein